MNNWAGFVDLLAARYTRRLPNPMAGQRVVDRAGLMSATQQASRLRFAAIVKSPEKQSLH